MLCAKCFSFCVSVVVLLLAATAAQASYMDAVLADNPLGYWRLGETGSTTALDSSSNANSGTAGTGVALGGTTGIPAGAWRRPSPHQRRRQHSRRRAGH